MWTLCMWMVIFKTKKHVLFRIWSCDNTERKLVFFVGGTKFYNWHLSADSGFWAPPLTTPEVGACSGHSALLVSGQPTKTAQQTH